MGAPTAVRPASAPPRSVPTPVALRSAPTRSGAATRSAHRSAHRSAARPAPDPAVWVAGLYAATLLTQRVAVPGTPVALAVPLVLAWGALGVRRGVLELSRPRALVWLGAFGLCGLLLLVQTLGGFARHTSVPSWGLFAVTWLPLVLALRDRSWAAFARTGVLLVRVGLGLATLSLAFIGVQLAGAGYVDVVAAVVPDAARISGYVTTYPVSYGSEIFRSNAWIGLEASIVSFHLGALAVLAILLRRSVLTVGVLVGGLLATTSGSGIIVLVLGVAAVALGRRRALLTRLALPGLAAVAVLAVTPVGQSLLARTSESGNDDSSSNLRAYRGFVELWPYWRDSLPGQWLGSGAGAAQQQMENTAVVGLVAPTGARLFFDYGLVAGLALLAVLLTAAHRSWAGPMALGVVASFLVLQPATTNACLVVVLLLGVTLWCPRGPADPPARAHSRSPRRDRPDPPAGAVALGPPTEVLGIPTPRGGTR